MTSFKQMITAAAAPVALLCTVAAAQPQETVSFDQILAQPANLELNLRYATQRLESGDLLAAAATLERLLLLEPNWDDARLLYAGVLFRLGDVTAAQREIELLEGRDLSEEATRTIQRYKNATTASVKLTTVRGRFSIGGAHDDNAGGQIAEDVGNIIGQSGESSITGRAALTVERRLSPTSNTTVFVSGDAFTKQFVDSNLDGFTIVNARAGLRGGSGANSWRGNLVVRDTFVGSSNYLLEYGIAGLIARELTPKTRVRVSASLHDQKYESVFGEGDGFAELRDGQRYDVMVGGEHNISATTRVSAAVSYRDKSADIETFAYEFTGVQGGLTHFFDKGIYFTGNVIFRDYTYGGQRQDDFLYGRAAVGIPVTAMTGPTGTAADDLSVEVGVSYSDRSSTVDVFDFENTGVEARLIYQFSK